MQVADVPLRRGPRAVCRPEEHQNLLNQPGDLTARLPLQNQSCISHRVLRRSGRWGGRCSYVSIILALSALRSIASELEIDRYIALPIFKHFTIIGYRVFKKLFFFFCHIHNYREYKQQWNVLPTHLEQWAHTHTPGAVDTHTHTHLQQWTHTPGAVGTHTHLEQWTHTQTHTPGAVGTHTHTHTHLEQWAHTHTHLEQWTHTHTHLEQWTHTHTHTWSSGHTHTHLEQWTHTHTHTPGAVDTHTPGAVDNTLELDTHTWSSGHTHTHTHTPGAVDTHTHTHLEQWTHTHTHTHTPGAVDTHTHTHTHLVQWTHTHTHTPGEAPARPPHVALYKIHSFETLNYINDVTLLFINFITVSVLNIGYRYINMQIIVISIGYKNSISVNH